MATRVKRPDGSPPGRSPASAGPRGRDEVVDAVLDAAERLLAQSGPSAVSLRDIAAEADVTYSLINRHFGTKDVVIERLLERYATRWVAQIGDDPDAEAVFGTLLGDEPGPSTYLRLLAWSLLNDDDGTGEAHRRHALLDRLPALQPERDDAEVDTAVALATIFGWRFFGPFIEAALHLDADAAARVHEAVRAAATR